MATLISTHTFIATSRGLSVKHTYTLSIIFLLLFVWLVIFFYSTRIALWWHINNFGKIHGRKLLKNTSNGYVKYQNVFIWLYWISNIYFLTLCFTVVFLETPCIFPVLCSAHRSKIHTQFHYAHGLLVAIANHVLG